MDDVRRLEPMLGRIHHRARQLAQERFDLLRLRSAKATDCRRTATAFDALGPAPVDRARFESPANSTRVATWPPLATSVPRVCATDGVSDAADGSAVGAVAPYRSSGEAASAAGFASAYDDAGVEVASAVAPNGVAVGGVISCAPSVRIVARRRNARRRIERRGRREGGRGRRRRFGGCSHFGQWRQSRDRRNARRLLFLRSCW